MSIGYLVTLVRGAVWQVFLMAAPVLGAALIIGWLYDRRSAAGYY